MILAKIFRLLKDINNPVGKRVFLDHGAFRGLERWVSI